MDYTVGYNPTPMGYPAPYDAPIQSNWGFTDQSVPYEAPVQSNWGFTDQSAPYDALVQSNRRLTDQSARVPEPRYDEEVRSPLLFNSISLVG